MKKYMIESKECIVIESKKHGVFNIIVDANIFDELKKYKWHIGKVGDMYYAQRSEKRKLIRLHRILTGAEKGEYVDHINGNTLDNRLSNLRICTNRQNCLNTKKRKGNLTSKYKGVHLFKRDNIFVAQIKHNGKILHLGRFKNEDDAAIEYNKNAVKFYGEFAKLNEVRI